MTAAKDRVRLKVGTREWSGFSKIGISRGLERAAGDFAFDTTLKVPDIANPVLIRPLSRCQVFLDTEQVINGFVDAVSPSFDAASSSAGVSGRSATGDLVDCSATGSPSSWSNLTVAQIARSIAAPYSVGVIDNVRSKTKIPRFRLNKNEHAFDAIERLARLDALLVTDNPVGALCLDRVSDDKSTTVLELGQITAGGILAGAATFDGSGLYSELRVKGQRKGADKDTGNKLRTLETVGDDAVERFRLLLMDAPGRADRARCREVARWEQAGRLAKSIQAQVTVRGWRQKSGTLWRPNLRVDIDCWRLALFGELLISEIGFSIDKSGGAVTTLHLSPPDAFVPLDPKKKKKGSKGSRKAAGVWLSEADLVTLQLQLQTMQARGFLPTAGP